MTGAMYAAIGGLKTHMSNLNVIGNNIANVNTFGYKAGRMTFKESLYTTSRAGSNGGVTAGGNNPSQIGYGCSVGSIDLNMSPSTYAPTGRGLDVYMDGEGFYMFGNKDDVIQDAGDLTKLNLSRVGDLWIDPDGYICNHQGAVLFGFARVQNPNYDPSKGESGDNPKTIVSSQLTPLRVPLSAARPTEENGGLVPGDATANPPTEDVLRWEEGEPVYPVLGAATEEGYHLNNYVDPDTTKDGTGVYDYANQGGGTGGGTTTTGIGYNTSLQAVAKNQDPLTSETMKALHVQLKSVSVEKNGAITGLAPNGDTVVLGYIAVANVDSSDGVTHIDGPYYKAMGGAGKIRVSALNGVLENAYLSNQDAKDDKGNDLDLNPANAILNDKDIELINSGLEASSTDVANEFTEMIKTQRGYQANTRIITVTDSMLEELVNMKR